MTTRRRELLIAFGAGALAWAGAVHAQAPSTLRRIGMLSGFSPSGYAPSYQAFRLGLRDLGWVEGKNISIEYRYAEGRHDRLPDLAADLVRLKVDVIATTATSDTLAAQKATRAIPNGPGGEGETAGTAEGNGSQALPRGGALESAERKRDTQLERKPT